MVFFGPSLPHLRPFITIFSYPLTHLIVQNGEKPFFWKANYKMYFGTSVMLYTINSIINRWLEVWISKIIYFPCTKTELNKPTYMSFVFKSMFVFAWDSDMLLLISCDRLKICLQCAYILAYEILLCCLVMVFFYVYKWNLAFLLISRPVTRIFLGQRSFLGIWALR